MIRLFAAIEAPREIGEGLVRRQQGLPGARWRPPETLHVTLRFFGEVAETQAADLDAELATITAKPFALELDGVGSFGEAFDPRAVWAGVKDEVGALGRLAGRCESAARRAGLKAEGRAYHPHLTLAYLRHAEPARVAAWIQGHNLLKSPPFRVDRFGLYSSTLGTEGSVYRVEREYEL